MPDAYGEILCPEEVIAQVPYEVASAVNSVICQFLHADDLTGGFGKSALAGFSMLFPINVILSFIAPKNSASPGSSVVAPRRERQKLRGLWFERYEPAVWPCDAGAHGVLVHAKEPLPT